MKQGTKNELGQRGELIAANYFKKQKYKILCKNFRVWGGEIDLIAKNESLYLFVEVKTRKSISFGRAEDAFDSYKKKHIEHAINRYFNKITDQTYLNYEQIWQCDLVAINFLTDNFGMLNHYVDVWEE